MASLKEAQTLTQRVRKQADELHRALKDGDVDFGRIVTLADELGDAADRVASTFETIDAALSERLGGESGTDDGAGGGDPGRSAGRTGEPGGRNGSAEARARPGNSVTRQELLQRARESGIAGRSEMSKDELITALQAAGQRID